jgi:protease secretion system membrane fusion protein
MNSTSLASPPDAPHDTASSSARKESRKAARFGLWVLGIGFGGFLLWAAYAPLDEGVPANGTVALDTKRKSVQHQTGGIVREVHVREGDVVKEGDLLIKLDDAVLKANYEAVRQRYLSFRATESRLRAELAGAPRITFHPDVLAAAKEPHIAMQMANQEQLMSTRRAALAADTQAIEENIVGLQGSIKAYDGVLASRKQQYTLINEELNSIRGLVKEGYAPKTRQSELERMLADSMAAQTDIQGNIMRARQSIAELRQRAVARRQDYRKELETQLAEVSRELESDATRLQAAREELGRTKVLSPADGQVVGLMFQTVGGVIPGTQKIMDIVPVDEALLLEIHVPPHMIDRVHEGMPVDVRFSTFKKTPQLVVEGSVVSVSKDLLADQPNQPPYYLARVGITPTGLKELGERRMQPGMPVEVVFKTGERSLLTYITYPIIRRIASAMKEE